MHKRASDLGVEALRTDTQTLLAGRRAPYLALSWRAAGESPVVERTLAGHASSVRAVTATPDSRHVISGAFNGSLNAWDVETGQEQWSIHAHDDAIHDLVATPDGRLVISAAADGSLKAWDVETGEPVGALQAHGSAVNAVAVTPDGRRAVSGSEDNTLKVWNLETFQEIRTLGGLRTQLRRLVGDTLTALVVTPDGRRAVSGSYDGPLKVWDLDTGRMVRRFEDPSAEHVQALTVTPDGRHLISGPFGGLVVWDLETGEQERVLQRIGGEELAVTPDGRFVLVLSGPGDLTMHDLATGRKKLELGNVGLLARGLAVTPDGRWALSGQSDGTVKVWDIAAAVKLLLGKESRARASRGHSGSVQDVLITPDGRRGISLSLRRMRLWDIEAGREMRTLRRGTIYPSSSRMTVLEGPCRFYAEGYGTVHLGADRGAPQITDGPRVLYYAGVGGVRILNPETGEDEFEIDVGPVTALAATPDGRRAVYGLSDGRLSVWNMATGLQERLLSGHKREVNRLMMTRDGRRAVSMSLDQTMKVWELPGEMWALQERKAAFTLRPSWPCTLAPDGRWLIGAQKDLTIKVWDLATGDVVSVLRGHRTPITALALTPDGQRLVSASQVGILVVWNLQRGLIEQVHSTIERRVVAIALAAQDGHVFSLAGRSLQVTNLQGDGEVARVSLEGPLKCIALASHGMTALVGDGIGNVYGLRLSGALDALDDSAQ
jgi:WD40 repeat protein